MALGARGKPLWGLQFHPEVRLLDSIDNWTPTDSAIDTVDLLDLRISNSRQFLQTIPRSSRSQIVLSIPRSSDVDPKDVYQLPVYS